MDKNDVIYENDYKDEYDKLGLIVDKKYLR
jgi:hypothetical protein